jgi:hypothetical protein
VGKGEEITWDPETEIKDTEGVIRPISTLLTKPLVFEDTDTLLRYSRFMSAIEVEDDIAYSEEELTALIREGPSEALINRIIFNEVLYRKSREEKKEEAEANKLR